MGGDLVERVRSVAVRVAATYGLEILDVQFRREGRGMVLRVQLDRPGPSATADDSVGVDDCARVSRDLSAGQCIEQSGLTDIRQTDDAALNRHLGSSKDELGEIGNHAKELNYRAHFYY